MEFVHKSVLLNECIDNLNIKPDGIYVDGTLGGAGHSLEIVKRLSSYGRLIGIDRDSDALDEEKEKLDKVDGILLDLGVSSYQLDERNRGFSYLGENELDMRMDKSQNLNAKKIINEYPEEKIAKIIYEYGEEKYSRSIAKKICEVRKQKEICTTKELVDIIESAVPAKYKYSDSHPAKRTFQATRIEVNNEIKPLYNTVMDSVDCLKENGRLCVITFHSLEDRAVKNAMVDSEGKCTCPPGLPYCSCGVVHKGKIINRKPILPSKEEMEENSRSKSAKLRVFEKY